MKPETKLLKNPRLNGIWGYALRQAFALNTLLRAVPEFMKPRTHEFRNASRLTLLFSLAKRLPQILTQHVSLFSACAID
jgi:hypothetical protein